MQDSKVREHRENSSYELWRRILYILVIGLIVFVLWLFFKMFTPRDYDSSLYEYKVDLSTMKDVIEDEELVEKFCAAANKLEVYDGQEIQSTLYTYNKNWHGEKKEKITVGADGVCNKEIETRVSWTSSREKVYDIIYESEFEFTGLNRLYSSATGYVGIFNFLYKHQQLGDLNMVAYVYMDSNMNKMMDIVTGSQLRSGLGVYKKEIVYDIESLKGRKGED